LVQSKSFTFNQPEKNVHIRITYGHLLEILGGSINWRDVQRKNVENNGDMSSLRAPTE